MEGKTLSHFRVLAKLGQGGMGVVYKAQDETLRRPVALKVLPPELVADPERRERFLREARTAAAVSHPAIATIHEVGEDAGIVFIALELVEARCRSGMPSASPRRSPRDSRALTRAASSIAISSRKT
jgi:serine/threonine protein kinase